VRLDSTPALTVSLPNLAGTQQLGTKRPPNVRAVVTICILLFSFLGCFIVFVVVPGGQRAELEKQMKIDAELKGAGSLIGDTGRVAQIANSGRAEALNSCAVQCRVMLPSCPTPFLTLYVAHVVTTFKGQSVKEMLGIYLFGLDRFTKTAERVSVYSICSASLPSSPCPQAINVRVQHGLLFSPSHHASIDYQSAASQIQYSGQPDLDVAV